MTHYAPEYNDLYVVQWTLCGWQPTADTSNDLRLVDCEGKCREAPRAAWRLTRLPRGADDPRGSDHAANYGCGDCVVKGMCQHPDNPAYVGLDGRCVWHNENGHTEKWYHGVERAMARAPRRRRRRRARAAQMSFFADES